MRFRELAAKSTIAAYLVSFVLSDYQMVRLQAASQAAPDAAAIRQIIGVASVGKPLSGGGAGPASLAGQPEVLAPSSALSAAIATSVAGPAFGAVSLLADWDGREDLTADRSRRIDDQLANPPAAGKPVLTRAAISEHTVANGFNENVYYYGDSAGGLSVVVDQGGNGTIDNRLNLSLPTMLNAFGTLSSDSQVVVTGLCVNPVSELSAYAAVNGAFAFFNTRVGEQLIVTFTDFGGGLRITGSNQLVRSGVLAYPMADVVSPAAAPPGIQTPVGFPITFGGGFGIAFSPFANVAGCAVDDDGSVYFQQVDLQQFTGANIVKIARTGTNQDRALATSPFQIITTLNPANGVYGTVTGPAEFSNRFTNYSGTSTTWGNIAALAAGPNNTLYAAVAQSASPGSASTGLFDNSPALGPTPSMIISFADTVGTLVASPEVVLQDGIADAVAGAGPATPGVNNFRVFAQGSGPDRRGANAPVFGTIADTLKLDFQVDFTIYSGLAVNEARDVFLISGGTPAGVGRNPSPTTGEIQVFTDRAPADRRADYVDLRGDGLPDPPGNGGTTGDGDSDRFDHIFAMAPLDAVSLTPAGLAGLSTGFLRYTNRLAPNAISPGVTLGQTVPVQTDDSTAGPIFFGGLDPGFQAGGGDDFRLPSTGDDAATGGVPPVANPASGGFEFNMGTGGACVAPWNAFFLNSNGNITFGAGDTDFSPTAAEMLTGVPRIAPAWRDFNLAVRPTRLSAFPIQALGFAGVNEFKVRWINAVRFDAAVGAPSRNTFSVAMFDDGIGQDENAAAGTVEGPTDNRFLAGPNGAVAALLRPDGVAPFTFDYGWMDDPAAFSPAVSAALTGYSIGSQPAGSIAEVNLSELGRNAIVGAGRVAETAIFELFNANDFDLRSEGNDGAASTPAGQPNPNREVLDFFGRTCASPALRLTTEVVGSGSVTGTGIACPGDCEELFPSGTSVTLTATAAPGFNFSDWIGCDAPAGASCTVTMNASKLVAAQFVTAPRPPEPLQGTLNRSAYTTGQVLTLTLTLDPAIAGPGPVDAYVVFDLPGGLGSYSLQLPIGASVLVPGQVKIAGPFVPFAFSGVALNVTLVGIPPGAYQLRTFLTQAGTMNVIGSVDVTPFTFTP